MIRLHRNGQIEDEVLHDLERDLDFEEKSVLLQRGNLCSSRCVQGFAPVCLSVLAVGKRIVCFRPF
jgi:hypothetical protein